MAVLKLPRMPDGAAIVNTQNGKPITALTRAWNSAMTQIETSVTDIEAAIAAADAAQSDADAAMAAAIAAQADADAAMAAAIAAQATADALDAALDVAAGKVLHVLNTLTLAAIDGSTLNIGTGGTLGTAAYTNASDYLPSGTSLAFLSLAGGTLTGPLIVNSTISVSGHTTFEGVTSTGATGTGKLAYGTSPTLTTPNIVGTATNDAAAAGSVGEHVISAIVSGSAVSLVSGAAKTVTSLSLTAGDWDVAGMVSFAGSVSTTLNVIAGSISAVTDAMDSSRIVAGYYNAVTVFASTNPGIALSTTRFSLASTTTVYLTAVATFGVAGCSAYGTIRARRVR